MVTYAFFGQIHVYDEEHETIGAMFLAANQRVDPSCNVITYMYVHVDS